MASTTDPTDLTDPTKPTNPTHPANPSPPRIAGIVLAAGSARRYGAPKQLVEVNGKALVLRAVRAAVDAGLAPVVVVVGSQADAIAAMLVGLEGIALVRNPAHADGVSTSIIAGLLALGSGVEGRDIDVDRRGDRDNRADVDNSRDVEVRVDGIAFLTCDQPGLDAALVAEIVDAFTPGTGMIVRPIAGDVAGHPVIFDPLYVPELLALTGDVGGAVVMRQHVGALVEINVGDPSRLRDLDRPAVRPMSG